MSTGRRLTDIISQEMGASVAFRRALLSEAVRLLLADDPQTAKDVLVEYINGTLGFPALGAALKRSPATLARMLSAQGNPKATDLFKIIAYLQKSEGVVLKVSAIRARSPQVVEAAA